MRRRKAQILGTKRKPHMIRIVYQIDPALLWGRFIFPPPHLRRNPMGIGKTVSENIAFPLTEAYKRYNVINIRKKC